MRRSLLFPAVLAAVLSLAATPALAAAPPLAATPAVVGGPRLSALAAASARAAALPLATTASTAFLAAGGDISASGGGCVPAGAATYRHSFDGNSGTATITADRPLCAGQTQTFTLVAYTAGAPGTAAGQFVYDADRATVSAAHRSVTLKVAVPGCYHQVDAFLGATVRTETTTSANPYGNATLGAAGSRSSGPQAAHFAGSAACAPAPAARFTNACDGTFTATLTNAAGANVPAVFLTGDRRIRISPGRSTTLPVTKGATLTLRDNTFTTYVATWRTPAAGCTTAPTSPAAPTATTPPAQPAAVATTPAPTPSSSWTPSTAEPAGPVFSTNPDAMPTTGATALARTGRSTVSVAVIALGLLMIGGGLLALTHLIRNLRRPA